MMKILKGILLALFLLIPWAMALAEPTPEGKVQDIQKQVDANKPEVHQPVLGAPAGILLGNNKMDM
ncbi:hypothetical protein [Aneurinibacillus aneurinilyticus]|uniref:hypothetical protein n=1 Tax=Aneurinibacillus aneurinilyticus TaxID=1391 RepID=UPI0023F1BDE7|nr:hypothetical protein [Aneurinibacillus aneurinilyticus]